MSKTDTSLRTIALKQICVLSLIWLHVGSPSSVRAEQQSSNWRDVSRRANAALRNYELLSAEQNYRRAIDMLKRAEPDSEPLLDLKLALAESMRRNHKLSEAKVVLDEVEQSISNSTVKDSLLMVRYWRRRAALQTSMKLPAESATSHRKAFAYWKKLFPQGTKLYVDKTVQLLDALMLLGASRDLLAQMCEFRADFGRKPLPPRLRDKYRVCCAKLRVEADVLSATGHLSDAAQILIPLSQIDDSSNELLGSWQTWLEHCMQTKTAPSLTAANASIEQAIAAARGSGALDEVTELKLRLAQIQICEQQDGKSDQAEIELGKIIARLAPLTSSSSSAKTEAEYEHRHKLFQTLHRTTWDRFKRKLFDDFTLKLAQIEAALTPAPAEPKSLKEPLLTKQASDHAEARYLLTLLLVRRREPGRADSTLSTISPLLARTHHENHYERVARLRLRIGWEYLKKHQRAKTQQQLDLAEAALKELSPSSDKAPIQKLVDELNEQFSKEFR
ncbi:MAG: hypothetical protein K2W95_14090 [Candidatus Obscuribacterales bacterium]|nr:hypothetical protein [Candidatus Obscuribacterales bacterium]